MADTPTARVAANLYPWHDAVVQQWQSGWLAQRFPHAMLLQGAEGLGTSQLAAWLASAVLCETSTSSLKHCGQCASCLLIVAGSHPDLLYVSPEEDKQQISVDQIRATTERLMKTSYRQGYKIAIVAPAHQMTPSAANGLLKTLEEPTPQSLLILVTSRPSALLPTVRSRCQKVTVQGPPADQALQWLRTASKTASNTAVTPQLLEFAGRAPLRALELAQGSFEALDTQMQRGLRELLSGEQDVTQIASEWAKQELPERLIWLDLWLTSLTRQAIGGSADLFTFPARSASLPSVPAALNISALYTMIDRIRALKAQLTRTALQRELAVESILIALLHSLAPASSSGH